MTEKTQFTIEEVQQAFSRLQDYLNTEIGEGVGDNDRFLINDVAIDVVNVLTGKFISQQVWRQ